MNADNHNTNNGGNETTNLNANMHVNVNNINNYKSNQEYGVSVGINGTEQENKNCDDNKNPKEVILLEEEEITWSQIFNMMYTDAKDIISPLSKIIDYVAPDPNEEDSRLAKMAFEEKMSGKIKKPIMKYKIGSPDTMCIIENHNTGIEKDNVGELESIYNKWDKEKYNNSHITKKRGLVGSLIEENVSSAIEILKSANNNKKNNGSVWAEKKYSEKGDNINSICSPETNQTPSTYYNTDSSPNSVASRKEGNFELKYASDNKIVNEEDGERKKKVEHRSNEGSSDRSDYSVEKNKSSKLSVVIPKLSLLDEHTSELEGKRILSNDSLFKDDTVSGRIKNINNEVMNDNIRRGSYTDRLKSCMNNNSVINDGFFSESERNFECGVQGRDTMYRNKNSYKLYYHSHAYTMENISNTIQRPISRSIEEILRLYSKEELEKIKNFVRKSNELVYEGPLEKKNSWSWGYKLRWVRISNCEMHYFLSPKESRIKGKSPLGIINFKVAEWNLNISSSDDKTFTIVSYGNNRNGRGYQWRVPENSEQSRKSWTNRIEKIIKATAFMQQLKGVIKLPV
ncbi:hypothetical protein FG379_002910 [Cryptosporidium bovis]|uniref:uncharacterized protein n=1 Tax=Cryptosporidium bovis TaxID=310047 RepID=UPI003519FD94|nr:hypothetical protein FG379_002910 [Cryptosporidium bovis]